MSYTCSEQLVEDGRAQKLAKLSLSGIEEVIDMIIGPSGSPKAKVWSPRQLTRVERIRRVFAGVG